MIFIGMLASIFSAWATGCETGGLDVHSCSVKYHAEKNTSDFAGLNK